MGRLLYVIIASLAVFIYIISSISTGGYKHSAGLNDSVNYLPTSVSTSVDIGLHSDRQHYPGYSGRGFSYLNTLNISRLVHARLEIRVNNEKVYVIDPDPFTKNIQYLFNAIIFFTSYSTPSTNLEPIDINGVHVGLTGPTGSFVGNGRVSFYLSSSPPPQDIWNTVNLPSYELKIQQQYARFQFNNTYGWIEVTGWAEATSSFNVSSIYITTTISHGISSNEFLLAIDPVNLTIAQGDNVTITWVAYFPLQVQNNKGQTIFLRNTLGILFAWIIGQGNMVNTGGYTISFSSLALQASYNNYLCASSSTITGFSANPNGVCKSVQSYYSQQKDIGILYALFYQDELSTINTVYRQVRAYYTTYNYDWFVIFEITNINAVVNNEAYASIIVTDA